MGQAKNRGTFEERKNKSITDAETRRIQRMRREAEIEASMTPEQRASRKQSRRKLNTFLAIAAGLHTL